MKIGLYTLLNRCPARTARVGAQGFTLIELMIVVAVIAILAAIAYPSYQEQIRKSRRAQARADLVELAQLAERHYTANNTYAGFIPPYTKSPREADQPTYYTLTPAAAFTTASTFTITATAQDSQASDRCGNLTISNTGQKGKTGAAPLSECW